MGIGERIKELRDTDNQSVFGERFGKNRDTIRRYESGLNQPDAKFMAALCCVYQVNANWLLLGEGPKDVGVTAHPAQPPLGREESLRRYLDLHNALHETLFGLRVIETNLEEEAGVFLDAAKDPALIDNTRLLGLAYMTKCMAEQIDRLMTNHTGDDIA